MNPTLKTSLAYLALTAATGVNAEELGRLFFTAEQRAQLEYSRQQNDPAPGNARSLTVNGIVQKHGGERTVWINGVAVPVTGARAELLMDPRAMRSEDDTVKVERARGSEVKR